MPTKLNLGNGEKTFFNTTPHPINLVSDAVFNPAIRKFTGGEVVATIPPSGILLNANLKTVPVADLGSGIEVAEQQAISCDPIPPEAESCDYVIVSALYATAYRKLHGDDDTPLVTIRDVVVESSENPKPRGCRGFALA